MTAKSLCWERAVSTLSAQKSLTSIDAYVQHVGIKVHPLCHCTYVLRAQEVIEVKRGRYSVVLTHFLF